MLSESSPTYTQLSSRQVGDACPLCCAVSLRSVIARDEVAVIQNRFYPTVEKARAAGVGRLAIAMCNKCGFVFNRAFDPDRVKYDGAYENEQGHSLEFSAHVGEMAERILAYASDDAAGVLEIGCGQGRFLATLAQQAKGRLRRAVGYDPAWRGGATPPGVRIERRAFDAKSVGQDVAPDIVVLRHVIEHVPDPVDFLAGIRAALPNDWSGRLFVETPDLEWIVDGGVIFDFFYEHCNYFCAETLEYALARAGFRAHALDTVFRGQHLWIEAALVPSGVDVLKPKARAQVAALSSREKSYVGAWRDRLRGREMNGGIAVWGAGAKGVTFANLIDRNADLIDCLIDVNPAKQDLFIPVSAHQVLSPTAALAGDLGAIIVMNPNYRGEIEAELEARGALALVFDA